MWWAKPEEPWLSPLRSLPSQRGDAEQSLAPLPPCYSTVCWGRAVTFSVPRNECWSTSCSWFAPVPSPSWEQPAKTQPFLYFLPLLWSPSVSRREPKMTCDGLCFVSLNSLCVSHVSRPANYFEVVYWQETRTPTDRVVSQSNFANNELFRWVAVVCTLLNFPELCLLHCRLNVSWGEQRLLTVTFQTWPPCGEYFGWGLCLLACFLLVVKVKGQNFFFSVLWKRLMWVHLPSVLADGNIPGSG